MAISTPTKLLSLEEARSRALVAVAQHNQKYIEVGGGPANLPSKYHTIIDLPDRYDFVVFPIHCVLPLSESIVYLEIMFNSGNEVAQKIKNRLQDGNRFSAKGNLPRVLGNEIKVNLVVKGVQLHLILAYLLI